MKSWMWLLCLLLTHVSCSVKPEDAGLCKLSCSNAVISGNDSVMSIKAQTSPINITCPPQAAGQPLNDAFFIQFLVAEAFDDGTATKGKRPVPNVSIEALSDGSRSDLVTHNPNVEISGTFFNPERYKGDLTPKGSWCSDSCGIVSLEVFGQCPPVGATSQLGLQIHSGALYSDKMVFDIETSDVN